MTDAAKSSLLSALNAIGEAHEFAVSGSLDLVLPGLRIEGVGEIGLPVGEGRRRRHQRPNGQMVAQLVELHLA